jgi:hypothetical protein
MTVVLSGIAASFIISELADDDAFASLTTDEQLAIMSSAQEEVNQILFNNGRTDFLANNFSAAIPSQINIDERRGSGLASIAGTPILYTSALNVLKPEIIIFPAGVDYRDPAFAPDDPAGDTRTPDGFTAFASEDDTPFSYIAGDAL